MIPSKKKTYKCFHCYATANDSFFYLRDIKNLKRIKTFDSGVNHIFLFIAVAKARKYNLFDQLFVKIVKKMFYGHKLISLVEIFYKTNVGRDFSSYQLILEKINSLADDNDYIFFQNRSGYGPYRQKWYKKIIKQFEKFKDVAICGSTINFLNHITSTNNSPHVQTYAFLTKFIYMKMLDGNFPGAKEYERSKIINAGEIGLSQFFLNKKFKLSCIEWDEKPITNQSRPPVYADIKGKVKKKHYFYHRKFFKEKYSLLGFYCQLKKNLQILFNPK